MNDAIINLFSRIAISLEKIVLILEDDRKERNTKTRTPKKG